MGYIAFGSDSWDYSTVPRALRSQFLMLMGKPMPKADLERADPIIVNNNNNNNNNSLFDPIMKNTIRNTIFENKLRYGHPKKTIRLFAFAFLIFCSVMLVNLLITIMDSHSEATQIDRNSERYEL